MRDDPRIDPPVPAPYLEGLTPLPDDLLAKMESPWLSDADHARAELFLGSLFKGRTARVRQAREAWELANGVVIAPEPGWSP